MIKTKPKGKGMSQEIFWKLKLKERWYKCSQIDYN